MLSLNDLKIGTKIEYKNEPYVVVSSRHRKLARGGATRETKLRSLITGNVISQNFKASDKFTKPEIASKPAQFLYQEKDEFHFMDETSYEQFSLKEENLGLQAQFLSEGAKVKVLSWNNKPINIELPVKIILKVVEAPPGIRGNTAQGGGKKVSLETGAKITVPFFIKKGNRVRVNTETGEYVERV